MGQSALLAEAFGIEAGEPPPVDLTLEVNAAKALLANRKRIHAARDLGASPRRVLWDITLPLCRPAILSGAFLALAMSLDDFVISFFVYGAGEGTLPLKIYSSVKVGVSPRVNALCSLMIAAVFLAVAVQRYGQAVRKARCASYRVDRSSSRSVESWL